MWAFGQFAVYAESYSAPDGAVATGDAVAIGDPPLPQVMLLLLLAMPAMRLKTVPSLLATVPMLKRLQRQPWASSIGK